MEDEGARTPALSRGERGQGRQVVAVEPPPSPRPPLGGRGGKAKGRSRSRRAASSRCRQCTGCRRPRGWTRCMRIPSEPSGLPLTPNPLILQRLLLLISAQQMKHSLHEFVLFSRCSCIAGRVFHYAELNKVPTVKPIRDRSLAHPIRRINANVLRNTPSSPQTHPLTTFRHASTSIPPGPYHAKVMVSSYSAATWLR